MFKGNNLPAPTAYEPTLDRAGNRPPQGLRGRGPRCREASVEHAGCFRQFLVYCYNLWGGLGRYCCILGCCHIF